MSVNFTSYVNKAGSLIYAEKAATAVKANINGRNISDEDAKQLADIVTGILFSSGAIGDKESAGGFLDLLYTILRSDYTASEAALASVADMLHNSIQLGGAVSKGDIKFFEQNDNQISLDERVMRMAIGVVVKNINSLSNATKQSIIYSLLNTDYSAEKYTISSEQYNELTGTAPGYSVYGGKALESIIAKSLKKYQQFLSDSNMAFSTSVGTAFIKNLNSSFNSLPTANAGTKKQQGIIRTKKNEISVYSSYQKNFSKVNQKKLMRFLPKFNELEDRDLTTKISKFNTSINLQSRLQILQRIVESDTQAGNNSIALFNAIYSFFSLSDDDRNVVAAFKDNKFSALKTRFDKLVDVNGKPKYSASEIKWKDNEYLEYFSLIQDVLKLEEEVKGNLSTLHSAIKNDLETKISSAKLTKENAETQLQAENKKLSDEKEILKGFIGSLATVDKSTLEGLSEKAKNAEVYSPEAKALLTKLKGRFSDITEAEKKVSDSKTLLALQTALSRLKEIYPNVDHIEARLTAIGEVVKAVRADMAAIRTELFKPNIPKAGHTSYSNKSTDLSKEIKTQLNTLVKNYRTVLTEAKKDVANKMFSDLKPLENSLKTSERNFQSTVFSMKTTHEFKLDKLLSIKEIAETTAKTKLDDAQKPIVAAKKQEIKGAEQFNLKKLEQAKFAYNNQIARYEKAKAGVSVLVETGVYESYEVSPGYKAVESIKSNAESVLAKAKKNLANDLVKAKRQIDKKYAPKLQAHKDVYDKEVKTASLDYVKAKKEAEEAYKSLKADADDRKVFIDKDRRFDIAMLCPYNDNMREVNFVKEGLVKHSVDIKTYSKGIASIKQELKTKLKQEVAKAKKPYEKLLVSLGLNVASKSTVAIEQLYAGIVPVKAEDLNRGKGSSKSSAGNRKNNGRDRSSRKDNGLMKKESKQPVRTKMWKRKVREWGIESWFGLGEKQIKPVTIAEERKTAVRLEGPAVSTKSASVRKKLPPVETPSVETKTTFKKVEETKVVEQKQPVKELTLSEVLANKKENDPNFVESTLVSFGVNSKYVKSINTLKSAELLTDSDIENLFVLNDGKVALGDKIESKIQGYYFAAKLIETFEDVKKLRAFFVETAMSKFHLQLKRNGVPSLATLMFEENMTGTPKYPMVKDMVRVIMSVINKGDFIVYYSKKEDGHTLMDAFKKAQPKSIGAAKNIALDKEESILLDNSVLNEFRNRLNSANQ